MPAATVLRRPLKILRLDSATTVIAAAGSTTGAAPCVGWGVLTIYCRFPGAGTITVNQRLRANSTFRQTDSFAFLAAGQLRTTVPLTGEHVQIVYTNDSAGNQNPELIATMV